ncbi:neurofilament heavy polypeptide [Drosophila miranda]|uniref:neurofilament heavy polypeptide n=1 Tax=Drosophila miranda TaxID=7229 RepID=UPI0007E64FA4|nr:neurofilament heavy polypeptide [Drosophila miranda]
MELFDMVKATPPPLRVRDSSSSTAKLPETPSPQPPSAMPAVATSSSRQSDVAALDASLEPCKRFVVRLKRTVSRELTKEADEDKEPKGKDKDKDKDKDNDHDADDKDGMDDGDDSMQHSSPPKTKAQQKMFADLHQPASASQLTKSVVVRLKRLTTTEIESYITSFPPSPSNTAISTSTPKFSSTPMTGSRKRGRPRKDPNTSDVPETPSPPKKPKVHIKVPLVQNSGKNRSLKHTLAATPTTEEQPKTSKAAAKLRNQKLIDRFGNRFFGCMVKLNRVKMPDQQLRRSVVQGAVCKAKKTLKCPTKGRPRKSNLSVSFSESVEILGSNESSSQRRSTLGLSTKRRGSPKPTRLQRVDATGNVLEDILLATPTGKDKRRSCNGSSGSPVNRKPKRSAMSVPVMGLASLRLDDDQKPENDDEDEEYIVPNDLPRTQRKSTPVPKKRKKMSVTTTISDSETEQELQEPKEKLKKGAGSKSGSHQKAQMPEKLTEKKESQKTETDMETGEKLVEKCNSDKDKYIVDGEAEKVVGANEKRVEGEENPVANAVEDHKEKEAEAKEDIDAERATITKNREENENENDKDSEANVKTDGNGHGDENVADKGKDAGASSLIEAEIVPEAELGAEVEVKLESEQKREVRAANDEKADGTNKDEDLLDLVDETLLDKLVLEESVREERKKDDIGEILDLGATMDLGAALEVVDGKAEPPLTAEDEEDILEIQTSLEDVRQLHTPTSSPRRSVVPHQRSAVRIDSGDSEASFKSLSAATDTSINQDLVVTPPRPLSAAPSPTLPDELISMHNCNITSIDPTSGGATPPIPFFAIESERTSEDDDLVALPEHDFHLSSSRHAISRGTLDDIMTALDS